MTLTQFFSQIASFFVEHSLVWICAIISFTLSASLIPVVIWLCRKYHWYDTVDERKVHKGNIPRLGSVGFVTAYSIVSILYIFIAKDASKTMISFVIAGFIIFLFGVIDDFLNMRAIFKLLVQIVAALIIVCSGFRFRNIWLWQLPVWFSYILTFGWIIGIINAYNLIDGVDALCGSLSALVILTLGIIYAQNAIHSAASCFILVGAICGFLLYNKPKAKIFMGDGGSQFLGFMIAALPLYQTTVHFENNKFLIMLNLVAIPMIDTIAAIWRRIREHRGIMSPDRYHLHHKLMNQGFNVKQILLILDSLQLVLCIASGVSMNVSKWPSFFILIISYCFILSFFTLMHFKNKTWKKEQGLL